MYFFIPSLQIVQLLLIKKKYIFTIADNRRQKCTPQIPC